MSGSAEAQSGTYSNIIEYPVPTAGSFPVGIAVGPDGALWFAEESKKIGRVSTSGSIVEYEVPTANSLPWGIAAGPDGALWFTEESGNKIGRIARLGSPPGRMAR